MKDINTSLSVSGFSVVVQETINEYPEYLCPHLRAEINQIEAIQVRITNPNENELLFFKYVHTFHLGKSENNPFTKFGRLRLRLRDC